jgi:hypothetical protein
VPIVEQGLRTPELYGKVLADAWERAVLSGTDVNGGLLELAREAGFTTRTVRAAKSNEEFFRENVSKKYLMVDKGVGDEHGIYSHCSRIWSPTAPCAPRAAPRPPPSFARCSAASRAARRDTRSASATSYGA